MNQFLMIKLNQFVYNKLKHQEKMKSQTEKQRSRQEKNKKDKPTNNSNN